MIVGGVLIYPSYSLNIVVFRSNFFSFEFKFPFFYMKFCSKMFLYCRNFDGSLEVKTPCSNFQVWQNRSSDSQKSAELGFIHLNPCTCNNQYMSRQAAATKTDHLEWI